MTKPIALVGAFERDNFGDHLMGYVAKRFLGDTPTIFTAPHAGQVDDLAGAPVLPYTSVLPHESVTAIWCVGGEIGGANVKATSARLHHPPTSQNEHPLETPYIPRPSRWPRTLPTPLIITSAGFSDLRSLEPYELAALKAATQEATYITLRDPKSSTTVATWPVEHDVTPDIVHALPHWIRKPAAQGHVALQVNAHTLRSETPARIAASLSTNPDLQSRQIVVFAAGTSPGHDNLEMLQHLVTELASSGLRASLHSARHPLAIVDLLASSGLVVSTSLHCRIVAASYGVPRVSLPNEKLSRYARYWDGVYPVDVAFNQLTGAITQALKLPAAGPRDDLMRASLLTLEHARAATQAKVDTNLRHENSELYRDAQAAELARLTELSKRYEKGILPLPQAVMGQARRAKAVASSMIELPARIRDDIRNRERPSGS